MKGRVAAASAPPSGMPVWRTPMAMPRCWIGNHAITVLLPAGVGKAPPMPAQNKAISAVTKPLVPSTVRQNSPTSTLPHTKAARSPLTSTTQPAANIATSEPPMMAELNIPTCARVRARSACRNGARVGTPCTTTDTAIWAKSARLSMNHGRGVAAIEDGMT